VRRGGERAWGIEEELERQGDKIWGEKRKEERREKRREK